MNRENCGMIRKLNITALALRLAAFLLLTICLWTAPNQKSTARVLFACWLFLVASMLLRLHPSKWECLGCQKEFAARFRATGKAPRRDEISRADRRALGVLLSWIALNIPFFIGYANSWLERRFMVCLSAFYAVCDLICVLFFCPFQMWIMHNRCCTTCRIYNWDYLMMCTPLLPLSGWMARSACILAAVLFVRWEFVYHRFPERFYESSNDALSCARCKEQLCRYKRFLFPKAFSREGRRRSN